MMNWRLRLVPQKCLFLLGLLILLISVSNGRVIFLSPTGVVPWGGRCGTTLEENVCTELLPCYLQNSTEGFHLDESGICDVFLLAGDYGSTIYSMQPGEGQSVAFEIAAPAEATTQINLKIGAVTSEAFQITLKGGIYCCASTLALISDTNITIVNTTMLGGSRVMAIPSHTLTIVNSQILANSRPCITVSPREGMIPTIQVLQSLLSSSHSMIFTNSTYSAHLLLYQSSFSGTTMNSGLFTLPSVSIQSSIIVGLQTSMFANPCQITALQVTDSTLQGLTTDNLAQFCTSQVFSLTSMIIKGTATSYFAIGPIVVGDMVLTDSVLNEPQGTMKIEGFDPIILNNLFRHSFNGDPSIELIGSENSDQVLRFENNSWAATTMTSPTTLSTISLRQFYGIVNFGAYQLLDVLLFDYLNMTGYLTISTEMRSLNPRCAMLTAANDGSRLFLYSIITTRIEFNLIQGSFVYYANKPLSGIQSLDIAVPSSWMLQNAPSIFFPVSSPPNFLTEYVIAENVTTTMDTVVQNETDWKITVTYHPSSKLLVYFVEPLEPYFITPSSSPTNVLEPSCGVVRSPTTLCVLICIFFIFSVFPLS